MRLAGVASRLAALVGVLMVFAWFRLLAPATAAAQTGRGEGQTGRGETGVAEEFRRFRIYPHLDRAYRLINSNRLAEAKPELEACLALDAHDASIWSTYLDVLYRLKEYETIVTKLQGLGDLGGDPRLRRYHLLAQLERQDLDAVLEDLRTLGARNDRMTRPELQKIAARFTELARDQKRPDVLVAFLSTAPDGALSPAILYEAANALRSLGRMHDATTAYQRVASSADAGKLRVDAYKALGSLSLEQQHTGQGRELLMQAHNLQPRDPSIVRSLGDLALERGDWAESARWYRQWLSLSQGAARDDHYRVAMGLGRAYVMLSELDRAAEAFGQALRIRPSDVEAHLATAQIRQQQGRLVEALGELRSALNVAPTGDLNAQVGLLIAQLDRPKEALTYLERARELGVTSALAPALFGQLGYTYAALGQPKAALEAFEKALPQSQNQAAIHAAIGYASLSLGDVPSAINHFEQSLSLQDDPRIWHDLTLAYARAGKGDAAARAADHLRQAPDGEALLDAEVWNQMGESAFRGGQFRQAAALFRNAAAQSNGQGWTALSRAGESLERAEVFPEAAAIWEEVAGSTKAPGELRAGAAERAGYMHLRLAEPDRAASSFLLAIRLGHDSWQLHLDRALTLIALSRWNEALDESLASLQRHDSARGHLAAAQCFKAINKPGMATFHFAHGLENVKELEGPEQKYLLDELTVLYANEANYDEASKVAARSLDISADPLVALRLGRMQRRLGRKEEARATLDAIDGSSLPAPLRLTILDEQAGLCSELGDKPGALKALEEAATLDRSAARLFQLGTSAREAGDFDRATTALRASLEAEPGNIRYREALGYAYLQAGQLSGAAEMLAAVADREPDNVQVQQDLATVLVRLGDRSGAVRQLRQALDAAASAGGPAPGDDGSKRQEAVLRMRSSVAQMSKTFEGAVYFGYQSLAAPNAVIDRNAPALLLSQGGFELAKYLTGPQRGLSLIGRVMAVGGLADAVFITPSPQLNSSPLAGTLSQLAVGLRYKPFASENLNFSGERLIQLRRDLPDSWIVRMLYGKETGADVRPDEQWHPYALIYGDVAGFIGTYQSLITYGEARLGASWNVNSAWVLRPHIVAMARRDVVGTGGDALQVGAGMGIIHYFRDNGYYGPAPSLELRVYGSAAGTRPYDSQSTTATRGLTVVSTLRF